MTDSLPADPEVWHLVDQKLPAYGTRVLLAYSWGERAVASSRTVICGRRHHTDRDGEHWHGDDEGELMDNCKVYAWMPLPKAPMP